MRLLVSGDEDGPSALIFVDNWGLLRGEAQRFWQFKAAPPGDYVAGKAIVEAITPDGSGLRSPAPESLPGLAAQVRWLPDLRIEAIDETLDMGPGRIPRLVLTPRFSGERLDDGALTPRPPPGPIALPLPEIEPPPLQQWRVTAMADRSVKALCYELDDDAELKVTQKLTAPDLGELRKLMPPWLERREALDNDPPQVLEYWTLPGMAVVGVAA